MILIRRGYRMKHLKKLSKAIQAQEKQNKHVFNYAIPELWDQPNICTDHKINVNDGHVLVNPYQFYRELIDSVICKQKPDQTPTKTTHGEWIKDAFVYSMMVRATGSFDHDRSSSLQDENIYGLKETGTFLKAIAYLPTLKRMGIDVIYMLPISKYSRKDKKGELGSPYGVSNFFKIDEGLKDPITGSCSVEDEFKAFVEACHLLGMRVIIDIIPRTNSVNSDYILDHPDWFYWISVDDLEDYKPPMVPSLAKGLPAKKQYFKEMFESEEVINHIRKFKANPKEKNPQKWEALVKQFKENPDGEILDLVQKTFGLTIAPAFSDRINDPQPAWSDVTFFRLYLDHPTASLPFLKNLGDVQPYLLYDVAKSSYNPGKIVNQPLWDTLTEIIPHFIKQYGIDGARIDMGHALPEPLVESILKKAREVDENFTFIAEELDVENAKSSIKKGYNMIIGDGFIRLPRIKEGLFNSFVYGAINLEATMFAVGETHDTPRLSARDGDESLCEMITLANLFIPNTVPFLNSGQEVFEKQPMNTGLDCRVDEAFLLDKDHPYYGKLALFDRFAFNYNHPKRWLITNHLEKLIPIRKKYLSSLTSKKNVYPLGFSAPWDRASGMAFTHGNDCLLVIVNTEFDKTVTHTVKVDNLPPKFLAAEATLSCVFSSKENTHLNTTINEHNIIYLECAPFEVILFELKAK
jgi:starch synthase (maltosyl-transferring)